MKRIRKKRQIRKGSIDPHAQREAARYDRPIASREYILQSIADAGAPITREQLAVVLKINSGDDMEALRRRLQAMVRDGQLIRNRRSSYALVDRLDLITGRVSGHRDGYGFLLPDKGEEDVYLHARQMRQLFHGDRAVVRITGKDFRGRREGHIVDVLERNTHQLVGRFHQESGVNFVLPDNKRIAHDIAIPAGDTLEAKQGQIVAVEITEQPGKRSHPVGRVTEVLGDHMSPGMEIDIAIRSHDLPEEWPESVVDATAALAPEVPESAKQGRLDLRDVPLVTIDGEDARDFDDAIFCEAVDDGWRLLVAIADVSHYVLPDTALDDEARKRGTSVYFPERVIPMLPETLSNGLCSLNPDVDRLCLVCEMHIDKGGKLVKSKFSEAVMRSHARLTYDQVAAAVVDKDASQRQQLKGVVGHLDALYKLFRVLLKARGQRGAIDFETSETRIVFGADRKIDEIVPLVRNDAHKMIEECMIAANVAAARFLIKHKIPALFRVHAAPNEEKMHDIHEFLMELGLDLKIGSKPEAREYAKLLRAVRGRAEEHLVNTVLLRSLPRAVYQPLNIGHFGLAHENYVHFTSPIRRYPDLLVHRAIRHVLRKGKAASFAYTDAGMQEAGEHCSMTERRADDATRDAIDWLKCEYMLEKVGENFRGIVSSVTSFGIFVELKGIYVEGLIHVTGLGNDYFHYDPAHHTLSGERTNRVFRLGDEVHVKVAKVNLDERKVDFELIEKQSVLGKRRQKRRIGTVNRRKRR